VQALIDNAGKKCMQRLQTITNSILLISLSAWLVACGGGGGSNANGDRGASFDVNGDGRADLVFEISADPTPWRFGLSSSDQFDTSDSLAQTFDTSVYSNGKAIAVADANADGKDDVLVQLASVGGLTQWKVFLSDGKSSTRTIGELSLPSGDDARALAFTDIDGDGMADLFLQRQVAGVVSVFMSLSDGTGFATPELVYDFDTELGRPELIALEDINGDGTADLVFERVSGNEHCYYVRIFRSGAFENQSAADACWRAPDDVSKLEPNEDGVGEGGLQTVRRVRAIGVADVTGDGRSELVFSVTTEFADIFRVSTTPGAIQFLSSEWIETSWSYLAFMDGPGGTEWGGNSHLIYFDDGFSPEGAQDTLALIDLNDDGRTDLLNKSSSYDSASSQTTMRWKAHLSLGGGRFEPRTWLSASAVDVSDPIFGNEIGFDDFDGDGRVDVLINAPAAGFASFARLHVLFNSGTSFDPDGWKIWYLNNQQPVRIVSFAADGLTTVAHDSSALLAWAGTSDTKRFTQNELLDLLTSKGLDLKTPANPGTTEALQPGECQLVYDSSGNHDLSANFGTLACLEVDGITLKQQALYGGCSVDKFGAPVVGGFQCEIGLIKQEFSANILGVDQQLTLEGPRANACRAITAEFTCARLGAQVASVSRAMAIGDTGVGAGVSIGIGAGGSFGVDDGVISGELDIGLGIGLSVSFSLDYQVSGDFVLEHGGTGYAFVRDNAGVAVVSAGEAVIDAVNVINATGGTVVEGVGEGISYVADAADPVVTIGEDVVDLVDDGIDAIAGFFDGLGGLF